MVGITGLFKQTLRFGFSGVLSLPANLAVTALQRGLVRPVSESASGSPLTPWRSGIEP